MTFPGGQVRKGTLMVCRHYSTRGRTAGMTCSVGRESERAYV